MKIPTNKVKIRHKGTLNLKISGDVEKTRLHSTRAKRKRCYDVRLSRQEGSTDRPAGGNTGRLFLTFGGPVCAHRFSNKKYFS